MNTRLVEQWPHHWFGFFCVDPRETPYLPSLEEVTDPQWAPADKNRLVSYLQDAPPLLRAITPHKLVCPQCKRSIRNDASEYLTDNEWFWPCALYHFVQDHSVVIPPRFVQRIRSMRYQVPRAVTVPNTFFRPPTVDKESLDPWRA